MFTLKSVCFILVIMSAISLLSSIDAKPAKRMRRDDLDSQLEYESTQKCVEACFECMHPTAEKKSQYRASRAGVSKVLLTFF
jgi:hypothetical protein